MEFDYYSPSETFVIRPELLNAHAHDEGLTLETSAFESLYGG